ncbi:transmembrane protein 232 isoform X2 [Narcine bancroftii]|uniref:transmembrane protein 232 isoform X2 n=1 Tax=Narcine bancroftii TaxID=1343680 RepID=UPI003831460D
MPMLKIPIVHRFGIISQNDHLLLEAIAKTSKDTLKFCYSKDAVKKPLFEVTEQFVQEFKCEKKQKEKEQMIDIAKKMLTRNKHKAGLSTMGSGDHVNLPAAWTELALLAQCKGKIQEALDILLISLDHAPFHREQIPVLFFLAESVLYWICTDTVTQSHLNMRHVKIIKVGFFTFVRLFIFHLAGFIGPFEQYKYRLQKYLNGLPDCEACYQSYPTILLHVHFIIDAGEIICGSLVSTEEHARNNGSDEELKKKCFGQLRKDCQSAQRHGKCNISPVLRKYLNVWICVRYNIQLLDDALNQLQKEQFHQANWIDSALGLLLLGEVAKINKPCLKALKDLGLSFVTYLSVHNLKQANMSADLHAWSLQLNQLYCYILGDICLHGNTSEIQKAALTGCEVSSKSSHRNNTPGLLELLRSQRAVTPEVDHSSGWWVRYGAAYSLRKICHILYGVRNQDGIRNAAWQALQRHQSLELDTRVLSAIKVAEAELNGPRNPFIAASSKTSLKGSVAFCSLGWRIANILSELCLPPVVPCIPLPRLLSQKRTNFTTPLKKKVNINKKTARLSLRQEIILAQTGHRSLPDFNTRTMFDLRRIVEDQWRKELDLKLEEEEKNRELQLQAKQIMDATNLHELAKRRHT